MSYDKNHTKNDCDRCGNLVGIENLIKVKFLFLDRNDKIHADAINNSKYKDFKQYWVCLECKKRQPNTI